MKDFEGRVTFLPEGVEWTQFYTKCPCCGFDLNKVPQALIEQIEAEQTKQRASEAKFSKVSFAFKRVTKNLSNTCVNWVIFPFTKAKKYTSKARKKGFFGWKIGK